MLQRTQKSHKINYHYTDKYYFCLRIDSKYTCKPWKSSIILWWSRCCRTNEYSIYLLVLLKYGLFNKIYFTFFPKHKMLISYSLNSFVSFEQGLRTLLITLFITGFDLEGFFYQKFYVFHKSLIRERSFRSLCS